MRNVIVAIAMLILVGVVGATWFVLRSGGEDKFAQCRDTRVATGADSIGGPLSLIDENGNPVTEADMFTKPTLLYFGYSFCPDVCPIDNARNAEALDILKAEGYEAQMSMITVDPDRDTPEQLRDFTDYLHPEALGYTGSMEQILEAVRAYKAYFRKEENGDPDYYLVDHSTFTYLVLPKTGYVEFFKRDINPRDMADRVKCFIDASR